MALVFLPNIHVTSLPLDLIILILAAHRMGEGNQSLAIEEKRILLWGKLGVWIDYRFYRQ